MADSKYSIRLAAVDGFSPTFESFEKKLERTKESLKEQAAEIKQLNNAAKRIDGHQRLSGALEKTAADLKQARTEQERLKREQEAARQKAAQLASDYARADASLKALTSSTKASAAEVKAANAEHSRLSRELGRAENQTRALDAQQDRATATVRTLEAAQRSQRNELGRVDDELRRAGVDTGRLADEQKRLESATERANAALETQRGRLTAVTDAQGRVEANRAARSDLHGRMLETAAVAYAASRPIVQAMDLETAGKAYAKVANVSDDQVQALASYNMKLATDRSIAAGKLSATDLFAIESAGAQGNIGYDEIRGFTRDAAVMATAFDMDAGDAGKTMMAWRAGMGLDQAGAVELGDAVNVLGNNVKNADSASIADVLKRQGSVAMGAGFSKEDVAAIAATMLQTTESDVAATGVKNLGKALTQGSATSKPKRQALESIGLDPDQLAQDMQADAKGTLLSVIDTLNAVDKADLPGLLSTIFGEESIGAIMPLISNSAELRRSFDLVKDSGKNKGSMKQEAAGLADSTQTTWNRTVASFSRLSTIVGTSLLPAVNATLEPLSTATNLVADFAEENKPLTALLAGTVAGAVALKTALIGLKFGKLLLGQGFNQGSLARSKLAAREAQTATAAEGATARLNSTLNRLGTGAGAGTGGGTGKGKGKAGTGSRATRKGLGGRLAGLGKFGRVGVPMMLVSGGLAAADGLASGDATQVGSALGSTGGGLAGAWAGGAAGAAIGSVVPVVGTAIGGTVGALAGGLAGSSAGEWLGEKGGQLWESLTNKLDVISMRLEQPKDRLAAPGEAAQAVTTNNNDNRRSLSIAPGAITLHASADAKENDRLIDRLMQQLEAKFLNGGSDNSLGVRLGAGLTDGGS